MRRQFLILYRVFLLRIVDFEILSADGDPTKLLGQFAALLAGISFTLTVWLIIAGAPLPEEFLWRMAHFLIATTMAAVGLFSIFDWDSIFPSKQDLLVIAPLPVLPNTLFFAKLGALLSAVSLAILALNVFTGLIWPLYFSAGHTGLMALLRSFAAYWSTILLASAFMVGSVLAAHGIVTQLLPRKLGLRLSSFVQAAAFALVLGVYILEPSLETRAALTAPENLHLLKQLPSYWFLGLFEELNGSHVPQFAMLARYAWISAGTALVAAIGLALLSYWRTLHKIAEEPDFVLSPVRVSFLWRSGSPLQLSLFWFTLRTLQRSRQHRMFLSCYVGIGIAFVAAFLNIAAAGPQSLDAQPYTPSLMASLWVMTIAIVAVRSIVAMPIAIRANWVFRITELQSVPAYLAAIERTMLLIAVVPVCAGSAVQLAIRFSLRLAIEHLAVLGLLGSLLIEISLYKFRKIPFTCSYLPGKGNVQFIFWVFALLVLPLIHTAARLEGRLLQRPSGYLSIASILGFALLSARWLVMREARSIPRLLFDESYPPEIEAFTLRSE